MKTVKPENEEMHSHYNRKDLGKGVRGKYYAEHQTSHNLVRLKPEVAQAFPSEKSINEALVVVL